MVGLVALVTSAVAARIEIEVVGGVAKEEVAAKVVHPEVV